MNHRGTETQRTDPNGLSRAVMGACIRVHRELGPGLLESAYEAALACEMSFSGIGFEKQVEVPVIYRGLKLECGYRIDFVVEETLILELKAVTELLPVHHAQVLTYLRLRQCAPGILVNFFVPVLRDGLRRVVLGDVQRQSVRLTT